MRPADHYKLSPLSYAIVANTFSMNIPIPEQLTATERYREMRLPIVGPQTPGTTRAVILDGKAATNTRDQTRSPTIQASQDPEALDHVPTTTNISIEDRRTTEEASITTASPTTTEAEKPDETSVVHKVLFYMVPSAFVSLLTRMMGKKGAST